MKSIALYNSIKNGYNMYNLINKFKKSAQLNIWT